MDQRSGDSTSATHASPEVAGARRHAAFLDDLRAALVHLRDQDRLLDYALNALREHLLVDRAAFGAMTPDGRTVTIQHQSPKAPPWLVGSYPTSELLVFDRLDEIVGAKSTVVSDVSRDRRTAGRVARLNALGVAAFIVEPLLADDGVTVLLAVGSAQPREWRRDEIHLLHDVAGHLYPAVERARAERALRISETEFRSIFELSAAGAAQTNPQTGRFIRVNRKLCEMTGYTDAELLQKTFSDITHPDDRQRDVDAVQRVLAERAPGWQHEKRYMRKDGTVRWVLVTGTVLPAVGGKPPLAVAIIQDIHDRKQAEDALRAANEELREADRRKDEFLAMLAHELRNPLAPLRTALAILQSHTPADEALRRCHDVIGRQVSQMARLLDDLLDVSRLSRGKLMLRRGPVLLQDVLDAAIETSRPLIQQHGHALTVRYAEEPILLDADATRLTQVFGNLLNNAANYTESGGHLEVTAERDRDMACIEVRDNGIGIPAEMIDRVFELFTQASTPGRGAGGLGIGLALARRLVEMHAGTIHATSEGIGRGSTFVVHLPVVAGRSTPRTADTGQPDGARLSRRVLVADDNTDAAEMVGLLLESAGCTVRLAFGGHAAVREAEAFRPEVVLLDIGMPDLDGYEVCRRIRRQPGGSTMTIVALTGWGQDEDRRRSALAGFDHHVVKPVAPAVLIDIVRDRPHRLV